MMKSKIEDMDSQIDELGDKDALSYTDLVSSEASKSYKGRKMSNSAEARDTIPSYSQFYTREDIILSFTPERI